MPPGTIASLGRFVVAQAEQDVAARIADDKIDGNKRRQADHVAQLVMGQKRRRRRWRRFQHVSLLIGKVRSRYGELPSPTGPT